MKPKTKTTASLAVVGVDIGKEVFHLVGLGTDPAATGTSRAPHVVAFLEVRIPPVSTDFNRASADMD